MTADRTSDAPKIRVLLVDDHVILRQGLAAMINEQPDLEVCGEADGVRSALEAIERQQPDVAVVDLSLKDGDGLELIKDIRRRWSEVAVVVLSMHDERIYAERSLRAGALGYVMKAVASRHVMAAIRAALGGETYLSDEMLKTLPKSADSASAPAKGQSGLRQLSDRELQVLRSIGNGMSSREIAEALFISVKTVEAHREHIKSKLELANSSGLLRYAIEHNRVHG